VGRAVPAVIRALDILELFGADADLSVPDITARLGLPRTTVHELVGTLVERSYLAPVHGSPNRFRLGVEVFHLGSAYAERLDVAREGQLVAADVAAGCGETVHVAVLDGRDVVYVAKVDSTMPVRMVSAVGRRLPAHCTAVGLRLLASVDDERLAELFPLDQRLPGLTRRSITSPRTLRRRLAEIRTAGVAYDNCESNESVACVAAPVLGPAGATVAAMSISVPIVRWSDRRAAELTKIVTAGADQLSARLGYRA
jgi:IclR family KDG regulon transcriptional repressor